MGLDSVEIVMEVEHQFGITIPDREAERCVHVGDLVECVFSKCTAVAPQVCASAHLFYHLRSALIQRLQLPRRTVRPSSDLAALIPVDGRRRLWQELEELGIGLPSLQRSQVLVRAASVLVVLVIVLSTLAVTSLFGAKIAAPFAISCACIATYSAWLLTKPWATAVPTSCARISDAVHRALPVPTAQPSRSEVSYKVRQIVSEVMGLPMDTVTEDKHFVNDLHVD